MSESNADLARAAIETFNTEGVEASLRYYDPELEWRTPAGWLEDEVYRGHDGMRQISQMWIDNFDDYAVDVERVEESGERVAVLVTQRGKIKGSRVEVEQPLGFLVRLSEGRPLLVVPSVAWRSPRSSR